MSTIRYTAGGDYDPHDSIDITPTTHRLYEVCPDTDGDPFYDARGERGEWYLFQTDGIYANLKDAGGDTYMGGGAMGDVLVGGASWDLITGGDGSDTIRGGPGGDWIFGDAGSDHVSGGAGPDSFIFGYLSDFGPKGDPDRILDFSGSGGDGDKIDLEQIASFTFIGSARFDGGGSAQVRSVADEQGYLLKGDADGDGNADFVLQVDSSLPLTAADFGRNESSALPRGAAAHFNLDAALVPAPGPHYLPIA